MAIPSCFPAPLRGVWRDVWRLRLRVLLAKLKPDPQPEHIERMVGLSRPFLSHPDARLVPWIRIMSEHLQAAGWQHRPGSC